MKTHLKLQPDVLFHRIPTSRLNQQNEESTPSLDNDQNSNVKLKIDGQQYILDKNDTDRTCSVSM